LIKPELEKVVISFVESYKNKGKDTGEEGRGIYIYTCPDRDRGGTPGEEDTRRDGLTEAETNRIMGREGNIEPNRE
jgi:hypothetical protein